MTALAAALTQLGLAGLCVTLSFTLGVLWQARYTRAWRARARQLRDEQQRLRRVSRRAVAPDTDLEEEAARRRAHLRARLRLVEQQHPAVQS